VTPDDLADCLEAARTSEWGLAALLGVHPHELGETHYVTLADLPMSAAVELARVIGLSLDDLA